MTKPIAVDATATYGISARIAVIGPQQITSPARTNLSQATSAISADLNGRTKTADSRREILFAFARRMIKPRRAMSSLSVRCLRCGKLQLHSSAE